MQKEKNLTFRGNNKEEGYEALERIKAFVSREPNVDYYRFVYISIKDTDDIEHIVSEGGHLNETEDVKSIESAYDNGKKLLDECENLGRFYISANLKLER